MSIGFVLSAALSLVAALPGAALAASPWAGVAALVVAIYDASPLPMTLVILVACVVALAAFIACRGLAPVSRKPRR
jgi:membrane protein implicated in regulation of membrane protease activity